MKIFYYIIICISVIFLSSCEELFAPVKAPAISVVMQVDGSYNVKMDAGRNGSVFFTTDGSEPKYPESELYLGELTALPANTTIRAISYCPSGRYSSIVEVKLTEDISSDSVACE